jgi:hypothetical protein
VKFDNLCKLLIFAFAADLTIAAPLAVTLASHGKTIVTATANNFSVQVKISTHEEQIGKPSDPRPKVNNSNCTYSKYPCSIVDRLDIIVNGVSLFVPRSAFCDLADLNNAVVTVGKGGGLLRLEGGDGAEGFIVNIEFDSSHVKHRTLASGESAGQLLQDTRYRVVADN